MASRNNHTLLVVFVSIFLPIWEFDPKPNGGNRYLGIASERDKIVQAALLIQLEQLVDEHFSENNFLQPIIFHDNKIVVHQNQLFRKLVKPI